MAKHQRITGALFFIQGLLIIFIINGAATSKPEFTIVSLLAGVTLGLLPLVTGYGLLMNLKWGADLGLVTAGFNILLFPIGTALAIYYFWFYRNYISENT